jgi:glycosyltransferase involved in cell wall biosynthesis
VSISSHDGTPNTLLEAMACGCFPVLGDIESIREWITPGENGLLVDFRSPQATADAIIRGLKDNKLLKKAKALNMRILREKVDVRVVCERIGNYYQAIMQRK